MHVRAQIRQAITALVTGLPTTGTRVIVGRVDPDQLPDMPSLSVMWESDNHRAEESTMGGGGAQLEVQDLILAIEARAVAVGTAGELDDLLDTIAVEVQTAIAADPYLGGLTQWIALAESEIERSAEVEQPTGMLTLRYMITYRVDAQNPEVAIP